MRKKTSNFGILWVLLLTLLTGCGESEKEKRDKYQATVNPENGKKVEVNGEKFRIIYIGGVRFRFPNTTTYTFGDDYIHMRLYWPDIPPGKAPGIKHIEANSIVVQVRTTEKPIEIDKSKTMEQRLRVNPADYIIHDDLKLGLRIFYPKEIPDLPSNAYSLTEDALTPWGHEPVVLMGSAIFFMYAPQVDVRIIMDSNSWIKRINPDWKGIYLSVIETLNKYREDKQ